MKQLKSIDRFDRPGGLTMFIVKRADSTSQLGADELPRSGERIEMDGIELSVINASLWGDSEFNWWPEIGIIAKPTTP